MDLLEAYRDRCREMGIQALVGDDAVEATESSEADHHTGLSFIDPPFRGEAGDSSGNRKRVGPFVLKNTTSSTNDWVEFQITWVGGGD